MVQILGALVLLFASAFLAVGLYGLANNSSTKDSKEEKK